LHILHISIKLQLNFQLYKNPSKRVGVVQSRHHYYLIECNLYSSWYSWKIAHLAFNNNHSLTIWD